MKNKTVLIIDDDQLIREQLEKELKRNFFETFTASNGNTAKSVFLKEDIDIMLLDIMLPDADGLEILVSAKEKNPDCEVIVITGYGTQEIAIKSLRRGAIDYIEKPIKMDELYTALGRAQERLSQRVGFRYTLLVVDDDKMVAERLKRYLTKEGYDVFAVSNGKDALDIIENNRVDVIITDIQMGDMDGIEVLQQAKKLFQDIEGIMVTGHRDQEFAVKSLRAGAIDYITKPVNLDELLFSVKRAIERINLNRNRLYRNREIKITSEIITKMNEELEKRIEEKARELSQTQAQLFQTSKLATLGEMAAGMAHEMNQPLGGISLVAKYLQKLIDKDKFSIEEFKSGIDDIEASVKRMARIIQHIRTFARQDTLKFIQVDIHNTIESALGLLREQLRLHQIEVVKNFGDNIPSIIGEPYQLEQVWINLISNARDAVDEREALLSASVSSGAEEYKKMIKISTRYDSDNGHVFVEFSDNGIGMSKVVMERLLEPFFTTKEVGKATGLGMSISYGIIENHKGRIEVESKEGEGASIRVIFGMEESIDD